MKKTLSFVLVCIMLMSFLPSVHAADTDTFSSESLIKYGNVIMKKGESYAYVRGELENLPAPYEKDGKLYFSLSNLAEYLNTEVAYNSKTNTYTWYHYIYEYTFTPGKSTFVRYERVEDTAETYDMGAPAAVGEDGLLYVPLGKLSEVTSLRYSELESGVILFGTDEAKYEASDFTKEDHAFVESLFAVDRKADETEKIFYVDPVKGRDSYDGSLRYPFRNISTAKEEVRKYKEKNGQNGDIVVYLRGGEYYITEPITFGVEDSGLNGHKIIWAAYPGEKPILNGGKRLSGWQKVDDNIYRAFVGTGIKVSTFFEGEDFGVEARHPNGEYNTVIAAKSGAVKTEFIFKEGDIPVVSNPAQLMWSGWPGGPSGHWSWSHQDTTVTAIDYENKTVKLSGSGLSYVLGTGSRYYLKGAREFLDSPGEFFLEPDGWLYYWPVGEDIANAQTILPASNILTIAGNDANNMAENIRFENLNLRNTSSSLVSAINSANIQFDGCELRNAGGAGISVSAFSPATPTKRLVGLKVENCGIYNMGGHGISALARPHPQDVPVKYITVRNCRIDNVTVRRHDTTGIYLFSAGYSYIGHNVISDGGRFGIRQGGSGTDKTNFASPAWGDAVNNATDEFLAQNNAARNNIIEYNVVTRVMDDSQDGGAIYTYDGGINTVIRNNYMYDNTNPSGGMNVLYSDNKNPGIAMYDNVVFENHTHKAGGNLFSSISVNTYSKYAKVYNNLTVTNPVLPENASSNMSIYYYSPQAGDGVFASDSAYWTKNISYDCGTAIFTYQGAPSNEHPLSLLDNNLYYDKSGNEFKSFGIYNERDIKTAFGNTWEQNSLFGYDPIFLNRDDGDLRLHYTSPAYRIKYRDVDFDIGLTDAFKLRGGEGIEHMYVNVVDSPTDGFTEMKIGEKSALEVTLKDTNGYIIDDASVVYKVDNPAVATVDNNGTVTALSEGIARVTVTASKADVTKHRTVDILIGDSVASLGTEATVPLIAVGEKGRARSWHTTKYGRQLPAEGISYTSSDDSILSVGADGIYEGKKAGVVTITATDTVNNLTAQTVVTVKDGLFNSFTMDAPKTLVNVGTEEIITINPVDDKDRVIELAKEMVTATSSNESVMTVEQRSATEYALIPKASGTANIKFVVNCDGTSYEQQKNFYVLSANDKPDTTWSHSNYGFWDAEGTITTEGSFDIYQSGVFNLKTNGYNFWGASDQGTFGYKRIRLNPKNPLAEVIVKFDVTPSDDVIPGVGNNNAAFGVMLRGDDSADAADVHFRWGPTAGTLYTYRNQKAEQSGYAKGSGFATPPEMRLIFDGSGVRMYIRKSPDVPWELFARHTITLERNEILLGVAAYSQNTDTEGNPAYVEMLGSVEINVGDDVDLTDVGYDIANAGDA